MDRGDTVGVLRDKRGDHRHPEATGRGDRFQISLNTGTTGGVGAGDGEHPGLCHATPRLPHLQQLTCGLRRGRGRHDRRDHAQSIHPGTRQIRGVGKSHPTDGHGGDTAGTRHLGHGGNTSHTHGLRGIRFGIRGLDGAEPDHIRQGDARVGAVGDHRLQLVHGFDGQPDHEVPGQLLAGLHIGEIPLPDVHVAAQLLRDGEPVVEE